MDHLTASRLSVAELLAKRARSQPDAIALTDGVVQYRYAQLHARVERLARALRALGVRRGERVAILSENRIEYVELELAAAMLGAIVACLNWRLSDDELAYCIRLVEPVLAVASPRYAPTMARIDHGVARTLGLGEEFERVRANAPSGDLDEAPDPEDGLVILYTSGTTGMPKGALISQRAMVARAQVFAGDLGVRPTDGYVAWSPLFHMAGTDQALATLMLGGKLIVHDGFDAKRMCDTLATEPLGWLIAMPGMIDALIDALKTYRPAIRSLRLVGAMADLVPPHQLAELTRLLGAPYLNTFGSTETGLPPASGSLLAVGAVPTSFAKRESALCSVRLVDPDDRDVPPGVPGELAMRGPTLFSGYWNAPEVNAHDFRGGWFHMGDVFVRQADGTLEFVDRLKYLIKSGGENIYPAELERVLLAHPGVLDAAVVRKRDPRWGEVPVAFVAPRAAGCDEQALMQWCRERLASYKVPREIRLIDAAQLPRSSTGKIQRHEIERLWL